MSKFKRGDRVRCVSGGTKGVGWKLGYEYTINDVRYDNGGPESSICYFGGINGDGVYGDSLELVRDGETKVYQRRTFKLIKNHPAVKAGAIYQEKCDDGDQNYRLLDPEFIKYDDEDGDRDEVTYELPRGASNDQNLWMSLGRAA